MIPKQQILLGIAVFFLGAGGAFAAGYHLSQNSVSEASAPQTNEVLGTTLEEQSEVPQDQIANPPPAGPEPAPIPVPLPAANAPTIAKPKPKIDMCAVAKEELAQTKDSIEVKFQSDSSSAKNQYDAEQLSAIAQRDDLMKQRTQSINEYLTTLAVATSKYNNSAKNPADYQVYEQEQGAALAIHNHGISEIAAKETEIASLKARSQTKYDESTVILLSHKNESLAAAQLKYQTQIAGLVCP